MSKAFVCAFVILAAIVTTGFALQVTATQRGPGTSTLPVLFAPADSIALESLKLGAISGPGIIEGTVGNAHTIFAQDVGIPALVVGTVTCANLGDTQVRVRNTVTNSTLIINPGQTLSKRFDISDHSHGLLLEFTPSAGTNGRAAWVLR